MAGSQGLTADGPLGISGASFLLQPENLRPERERDLPRVTQGPCRAYLGWYSLRPTCHLPLWLGLSHMGWIGGTFMGPISL